MTRYALRANSVAGQALADALFTTYLGEERRLRGLTVNDSLDRRAGRVLSNAQAVTTAVAAVRTVAGSTLVVVPGAEQLPAGALVALVEEAALPAAVRAALAAERG